MEADIDPRYPEDARMCRECGATFSTISMLNRHLLKHTDLRPYKCFYCDYACSRKDALKSHCHRKHEMDGAEFDAKAKLTFPRVRPENMPALHAKDEDGKKKKK